jgi:hypothetical protein
MKGWSFFKSQPSPTLPPWWRYANPIHENQHVVQELPSMIEGSEIGQDLRNLDLRWYQWLIWIIISRRLNMRFSRWEV